MKKLGWSVLVLASIAIPAPAFAGILSTTGISQISAPTTRNYATSNTLQVFEEAKSVIVPDDGLSLDAGEIAEATEVDSFNIYLNTADNSSKVKRAKGSITFDAPIVGLIWKRSNLESSDAIFGASGTPYAQKGTWRGLEANDLSGLSNFSFADGGKTLNLSFNIWKTGFDELRVLTAFTPTAATPEPITMLGVGTAIGFGAAFKRKLAKKQK
jgi:hypothetical protein